MSQSRTTFETHVQSLSKIQGIRPTLWKFQMECDEIGKYDLIINLVKEFPQKPPEVTLDSGLGHALVNEETGQVIISELTYEWDEQQLLGSVIRELITEFRNNPPHKTNAKVNETKEHQHSKMIENEEPKPCSRENETITELKDWLSVTEEAKHIFEKKLETEQQLVKQLQRELDEWKGKEQQHQRKYLTEMTEMSQKSQQLKLELQKIKDQNNQLDQQIKTKDEIIDGLRMKCTQLSHNEQAMSKAETRVSSEQTALADFNRQLKLQIEDLKKQLVDKKKFETEKTEEIKELNEVNEKLESQNRSFSDRIKTLDEKVKELRHLEEQFLKKISERDERIALLQQQLNDQQKKEEEQPSIAIFQEKTKQIEEMTIQMQQMKEQACKETQMLQEQIQELQGTKQVQSQNWEHVENTDASDARTLQRELESVVKQLNVAECNLNLRVAQLIESNPVYRKIFGLIIGKLEMLFRGCQTISLNDVNAKEVLDQSVGCAAAELEKMGGDFLNPISANGLTILLIGNVVNIYKEMQLQQLFQNVSIFESKIFPQNTLTFAKLFALKLFAAGLFEVPKQEEEQEQESKESETVYSEKQLGQLVENCCTRAFVVLAIGFMNDLLENKVSDNSVTLRGLEQIVEEMLPMLEIGKEKEEFQEKLKEKITELRKQEANEEELGEEFQHQTSKEKEDEFEIVNAITTSPPRFLKDGWLEKAGEHFFSQAQRRKFTLLSDGSLFYEKGDGKNLVRNKIDLTKAKAVKRFGNFEMIVEMPDRKWAFRCSTINDRDQWMEAMASINGVKCETCQNCPDKKGD